MEIPFHNSSKIFTRFGAGNASNLSISFLGYGKI